MTNDFERKWTELKAVFDEYLDVIAQDDGYKDRDGDLEINRYYYGWGEKDYGWKVRHGGYVNEFEVFGDTPESAVDKATAEFKRLIEKERNLIARENEEATP